MTPPCAIALATLLFKNKFTKEERDAGPTNFIMGLAFITEGAIPFAASDPLHVLPSCIIGSALAGGDVIDVNWLTGAVKFIMFGSAGSLDSGLTTGKFVIPTHSYREEGLSYHYAPPADYIEVKNAKIVKAIFDELKLPNVLGKVWTTDAIYRETKAKFDARKKEGCIAVEMELAGVQAVCDFYGWELYNFLVTGDVLDQAVYDFSGLADASHNMDKLYIAIEIAKRI